MALAAARELGFNVLAWPSTATLANAVARPRPRRLALGGAHPESLEQGEDPDDCRVRRHADRRGRQTNDT